MTAPPRAVLVHRRTELDELLARHGTRGQAAFFLSTRGRRIEEVESRHAAQQAALSAVSGQIPLDWRRGLVERADLPQFLFEPGDVVVVVGQDGLVANTARYLDGQPVIGINPDPARNPGVLVRHAPDAARRLLHISVSDALERHVEERTMVEAAMDDGQRLLCLNEIYVGHASHQTARYTIRLADGRVESQASSGVIIGSGTGSTGWCRSAWLERHSPMALPGPTNRDLVWFVREAWPSPATSTSLTEGILAAGTTLALTVESDRLVAFGDGVESDAVTVTWGQTVELHAASRHLLLVR